MTDPYRPPEAELAESTPPPGGELASLSARFLGSFIDSVIGLIVIYALLFAAGIWDQVIAPTTSPIVPVQIAVIGLLGFLTLHGYTLATRGQTLGKVVMKTRIVSVVNGEILPLWKVVALRYLPLTLVGVIPFVGSFAGLIDALFVFRQDRRCLHDFVAGTRVIAI